MTLCPFCQGEGCAQCRGVGERNWEPPQRITGAYDIRKSMVANLADHSLKAILLQRAGESDKVVEQARKEILRRSI